MEKLKDKPSKRDPLEVSPIKDQLIAKVKVLQGEILTLNDNIKILQDEIVRKQKPGGLIASTYNLLFGSEPDLIATP